MKLFTQYLTLLAMILIPICAYSQSDEFSFERKPRWEAGLGTGYFNGVDYPGSTDPNVARFALPFFIYRSKIFRVGDGGVGAVAVEEPTLKLDVSFGGSLNAKPESDSVRAGLPDLDVLFELGPRLQKKLWRKQWANKSSSELNWDSKIRAVVATDFKSLRARGFVFGTGLNFRQRAIAGEKIDLILNGDITFGDKRINNYLYSVPVTYATATRKAYEAKSGYLETRVFLGLAIRPIPDLRIFTGVAFFDYANSANEDSPLFETTTSTQYAIGVVWTALRSKSTIDVYESD